jgi:hypothetical protein
MKQQDNFEVMSTVFLLYSVCNRYMRKYVDNIKYIHYVTIEYKREVFVKFKLVWRLLKQRTPLSYQDDATSTKRFSVVSTIS